jgi:protein-tyrosine-phosphatase
MTAEKRFCVLVLFVCMGNICRSPLAEGIFRKGLADATWTRLVTVDSAGTGNWHRAISRTSARWKRRPGTASTFPGNGRGS